MESSDQGSSLEQRLLSSYGTFTPAERRLADALIKSRGDLVRFSATELALEAGVSKASAARFFQKLGYDGFIQARRQVLQSRPWGSPLEALAELTDPLSGHGNLGRHIANDVNNLTLTTEAISSQDIDRAVKIVTQARRVLVVGFRNSYSLAAYAYMVLNSIRPDVRLIGAGGLSIAEQVSGLDESDAILAVGFRRRPFALRQILETASTRGASSVLVADATADKTTQLANVTLVCHNQGAGFFDSYVSGMAILNFLCSSAVLELGDPAWTRLSEIEELHRNFGDLVQPEVLE